MATRSNIRVILKEEDLNKVMHFDPSIIGKDSNNGYKIDSKWGSDQLSVDAGLWEDVNTEDWEGLIIYHHWDGYPEGVGKTLLEEYNTYEKALNLVLGGDCSTINGGYLPYAMRSCEEWEDIKPRGILKYDGQREEYDYMFEDGNWYVRDGYTYRDWTLLSDVLK